MGLVAGMLGMALIDYLVPSAENPHELRADADLERVFDRVVYEAMFASVYTGRDMDTATGKQAARAIAIDLMGTLQAAVGNLDNIVRIVKVMSLVNSTPEFTEQHLVTNGCSQLLGEVFGPEVGAHARSAFGVAQIPLGACVEIELVAEVR